jgi:hypothetical protein
MKVRWIQSPLCFHLGPISFGFDINFVHSRNFFIATDVLLRKKPFQCEQPCILAARGGTRTPDHVVCYLGMEHSSRLTIDCWSCCSSPSRTTKFDKNRSRPCLWRDFCALQDWTGVDILHKYNLSMDRDAVIFATVHYLWLLGLHQPIEYLSNCLPIRH